MARRILITGGAGFIGSHLADELLRSGYRVRALDNLSDQVHGPCCRRPDYLDPEVELWVGDVRDPAAIRQALENVDAVVHFAAMVGVGQSMYEIARYTEVNNLGTSVLLEALIEKRVEKLLVASSMSIYGEGLYRRPDGEQRFGQERTLEQLRAGVWEIYDADGIPLLPAPTPETKAPAPPSVYALSKFDQERLCLLVGRAYGIPAVALRFFNVFGTRQALSNPYTGVLAIFASRYMNGHPPLINEDGEQRRDFVHVRDVASACRLALESPDADGRAINVGSGRSLSILEVAGRMRDALGYAHIEPEVTGRFRMGDIRHCYADISLARELLHYEPAVGFEEGLLELACWLEGRPAVDRVDQAAAEMSSRGLSA